MLWPFNWILCVQWSRKVENLKFSLSFRRHKGELCPHSWPSEDGHGTWLSHWPATLTLVNHRWFPWEESLRILPNFLRDAATIKKPLKGSRASIQKSGPVVLWEPAWEEMPVFWLKSDDLGIYLVSFLLLQSHLAHDSQHPQVCHLYPVIF